MKRRVDRHRMWMWVSVGGTIVSVGLACLAWTAGEDGLLLGAEIAAVVSIIGTCLALLMGRRRAQLGDPADFTEGIAEYRLDDLRSGRHTA